MLFRSYLCHLPIVGLLQVDLWAVPAPALVKFLTVVMATQVLGLASYHVMVRYTDVGVWLHGRRNRVGPGSRSDGAVLAGIPPHHVSTGMNRGSGQSWALTERSLRESGPTS